MHAISEWVPTIKIFPYEAKIGEVNAAPRSRDKKYLTALDEARKYVENLKTLGIYRVCPMVLTCQA